MLKELTGKKFKNCHLDPDLYRDIYPRKGTRPGWGPVFGPGKGSYTHLKKHDVGPGDIIFFFGWFRHAEFEEGKFFYKKSTSDYPTDMQVIYGFMKIEKELDVFKDKSKVPDYAKYHPHVSAPSKEAGEHIYLGSSSRVFNLSDELILTKKGQTRSRWNLPLLEHTKMSSNPTDKIKRWHEKEGYFQTVGRGQEFVLDATPEVLRWVHRILHNRIENEEVNKNTIRSTYDAITGKMTPQIYENAGTKKDGLLKIDD
jgi:hypothetical protein